MTALVPFERWPLGQRLFHRHWWANGLCAACALVMHALLISPMLLGTAVHKKPRQPEVQGPGASAIVATAEFLTMVLISEPEAATSSESALPTLASRGIAPDDLSVRILSPDPNPAFDFEQSEEQEEQPVAAVSESNAHQHALLFGRYVNQISARIERDWIRPVTPVLEPIAQSENTGAHSSNAEENIFRCQARVLQDAQGRVLEIMLLNCNGNFEWQQSLVAAIQHASPFPAPAHPSIFVSALTLNFEDRLSGAGASEAADSGEVRETAAFLSKQ